MINIFSVTRASWGVDFIIVLNLAIPYEISQKMCYFAMKPGLWRPPSLIFLYTRASASGGKKNVRNLGVTSAVVLHIYKQRGEVG